MATIQISTDKESMLYWSKQMSAMDWGLAKGQLQSLYAAQKQVFMRSQAQCDEATLQRDYPLERRIEVLRDAMRLMERRGGCGGVLMDECGRLCIMGAIICVIAKTADPRTHNDHIYAAEIVWAGSYDAYNKRPAHVENDRNHHYFGAHAYDLERMRYALDCATLRVLDLMKGQIWRLEQELAAQQVKALEARKERDYQLFIDMAAPCVADDWPFGELSNDAPDAKEKPHVPELIEA